MNIWLPIVVNAIILGILILGICKGKNNGFIFELTRLVLVCGMAVGLYFLNPIVVNKLLELSFINIAITNGVISIASIKSLSLSVMCLLDFLIITLLMMLVKHITYGKKGTFNKAKQIKFKGITKSETKGFRKEQKKLEKDQKRAEKVARRNSMKTRSKVFGIIIGFVEALLLGFVIIFPLKHVFNDIKDIHPIVSQIETGFEYTPYGQLDNITGIVDKIIGE